MEILGPGEAGKLGFHSNKKKEGVKGGQDFAKVLSNEMQGAKTEKTGQSKQAADPHFPTHFALNQVDSDGKTANAAHPGKVIEMAEKVLARLEFFQAALDSPKVEISKFSPLIESLKSDRNSLEEIASQIASDPKLKNLADETAALAATEVIKYNRGDYG